MRWLWITGLLFIFIVSCREGIHSEEQAIEITGTTCPLDNGWIIEYPKPDYRVIYIPSKGITMGSYDGNIRSISDGNVDKIEKIKGLPGYTVLVRNEDNTSAIYTNIQEKFVDVGQKIVKGQSIGILKKDEKFLYRTEFFIFDSGSKEFLDPKLFIECG